MSIKVVYANDRGFITDLQLIAAEDQKETNDRNQRITLPRYGVWQPDRRKGCSQVTFTSDDLNECKTKLTRKEETSHA